MKDRQLQDVLLKVFFVLQDVDRNSDCKIIKRSAKRARNEVDIVHAMLSHHTIKVTPELEHSLRNLAESILDTLE